MPPSGDAAVTDRVTCVPGVGSAGEAVMPVILGELATPPPRDYSILSLQSRTEILLQAVRLQQHTAKSFSYDP